MSAVAPASLGQGPQPANATRLLYERHSGRIFGFCLSLLGSREDAEDAVQTTFLKAQRGLGRGSTPQFELAWLFKIARNVCNDRHQSVSRRRRLESTRDLDSLQDVVATPERAAVSVGELTRAFASVPERQRRALLLREWQGLSYDEIAAELGVSVAAVETLLFRARRSVAAQLEQSGTTDRRGVVASLASFARWLFKGGAAPLKVAAATATVAATAGFAVVPALRDHDRAPAGPVPAQADTQRGHSAVSRSPRRAHGPAQTSRVPLPVTRADAVSPPSVTSSSAAGPGQPARDAGSARAKSSVPTSPLPSPLPSVSVPTVTVPAITTPAVTVPEVSLPPVDLPPVTVPPLQLPVQPTPLSDLPSLP